MHELIKVDFSSDRPLVSARDLHKFLEVETPYHKWFPVCVNMDLQKARTFGHFCPKVPEGVRGVLLH